MTSECVLTEALADNLLLFVVAGAFCLHDALDDDVPGQEAHFRSLVHVVREVAIVTVQERLWGGREKGAKRKHESSDIDSEWTGAWYCHNPR